MEPAIYPTEFGADGVSAEAILEGRHDSYHGAFSPLEPIAVAGTSTQQIPVPEEAWAGIVEIEFKGEGRLAVCAVAANGSVIDTPLETTGPYTGTLVYGIDDEDRFATDEPDPSTTATSLLVDTDGPWSLTISSVADAPALAVPHSGTGDAAFWQTEDDRDITVTHDGPGDFTFVQYYDFAVPKVLAATTGPGTESFTIRGGWMLLIVRADGPWTIE